MRGRPLTAAVAAATGLLAVPAAPAVAQDDLVPGAARFEDQTVVTRMRPVPRGAAPSALVSRMVQGYTETTLDKFEAVPAIVVAPSGMTQEQRDEFSRTFRATPDGYFASLTMDGYDVVINGTLAYSVAPETLRFQRTSGRYNLQKGEGSTDIAFADFGGDYLISFICQVYVEGQEGGCVSDEDAVALFERMVPLGGGLE
jgi:hypothetical protein